MASVGRETSRRRIHGSDVALVIGSLVMISPFIWMLLSAFKPEAEIASTSPGFFPSHPTLNNFRALFNLEPFGRFFVNSVVVTIVTVVLVLFTSSLMGYVLAFARFRGAGLIFVVILAGIAVPFEVKVVPLYRLMVQLGWDDTYQSLILPFVIDSFGIYLFREFIKGIPHEYFDQARIDGASEWAIYRRVVLPLTRPVAASLAIFSFVFFWDQLLWPTIDIASPHLKTLPLGIALLSSERGAQYDLSMAAGLLTVIPPLIVFFIFQRNLKRGSLLAGLK